MLCKSLRPLLLHINYGLLILQHKKYTLKFGIGNFSHNNILVNMYVYMWKIKQRRYIEAAFGF